MAGLVPAIHVLFSFSLQDVHFEDVDARDKLGRDDSITFHSALAPRRRPGISSEHDVAGRPFPIFRIMFWRRLQVP